MVGRSRSILLTSNDDVYMIHDDDDGRWSLEKRKRAWDPLQSWSPRQRERRESRDNLNAFCFRKAKVATRGGRGEAGGNCIPDLN